ncbi:ras-related and estrogen-regulated growth inhibitor-like protein isoform X2 [Paroedura picta]|uniref:ras-related and estrogen-regulated growth inhibitor-like protein isoform X2 n=1 Tax=Paroedura picta TaxID=143630 RepID=UPI0040571E23
MQTARVLERPPAQLRWPSQLLLFPIKAGWQRNPATGSHRGIWQKRDTHTSLRRLGLLAPFPGLFLPRQELQMLVQLRTAFQQAGKMSEGNLSKLEANILVIGAEKVGKSALTVRFLTRRFIGEYGNIESIYTHNMMMGGREVHFSIWDSVCPQTAELQGCTNEKQVRWADGFILVYSICDRTSFHLARQQLQRIQQLKRRSGAVKVPIILVGNKRDLQHRRTVSSEEGRLLALSTDSSFFEISAAETYHGALMVFHELLDMVRDSRSSAKKTVSIRGLVRSMSAVFGRRRTD